MGQGGEGLRKNQTQQAPPTVCMNYSVQIHLQGNLWDPVIDQDKLLQTKQKLFY